MEAKQMKAQSVPREVLLSRLKRVESELQNLRGEVARLKKEVLEQEEAAPRQPTPGSFRDLYGILRGKTHFTWEEIQAAKYKAKPLPE
ncbi:MAG: hypothetical protein HY686_07120 [Chloroflexi bacterium]|nr:hypothetical protein [Chloroflexota bacterium]